MCTNMYAHVQVHVTCLNVVLIIKSYKSYLSHSKDVTVALQAMETVIIVRIITNIFQHHY